MVHSLKIGDHVRFPQFHDHHLMIDHLSINDRERFGAVIRCTTVTPPTILTGPNGEKYELHGNTIKPVEPDPLDTLRGEANLIWDNRRQSAHIDCLEQMYNLIMRTAHMIHKQRFNPIPKQGFIIRGFKQALSVGVDPDGRPAFWYTCDPQETILRKIDIYCCWTGQQEPDDGTFLGTFTYGNLVYHVWTS